MTMYYEAGLNILAMASGFQAETLKCVANASNFKRTHAFLMQVWEAFYGHFFRQYMLHYGSGALLASIRAQLLHCNDQVMEEHTFDKYLQVTRAMENECEYKNFVAFVEELASRDDTWKFWYDFVFHDCLAYIALYLPIRSSSWSFRIASLKEMCPFITAFDWVNYLKILPQHFAEILCLPENIRHCFEKGGFVCNIRGTKMHAVALVEAQCREHEVKLCDSHVLDVAQENSSLLALDGTAQLQNNMKIS